MIATNATARAAALRDSVRAAAENRPGVYRMLDGEGAVIYVGKSIRVRSRLLSYFRGDSAKTAGIIAETARIEFDYTPNEFASVLLELRQIRRWRPRFNVEHKREPGFWFIKLTAEAAPRLRQAAKILVDGGSYFGPFRGRLRIRDAVREISDLLELRDCAASTPLTFADQLDLFSPGLSPLCYRGEIGRCLAPCAGRCARSEYLRSVELARTFLEGNGDAPLRVLQDRMGHAASRMQFEWAAELRDRLWRLERVRDELVSLGRALENLSFVYEVPGHAGEDRVYLVRRGRVHEDLPAPADAGQLSLLKRRVEGLYGTPQRGAAVAAHEAAEVLLVARWFRLRPDERRRALPPDRYLRRRAAASPVAPAQPAH